MKSRLFIQSSFILLMFITVQSCGHKHSHNDAEKQGKEYTSAYICPMHCEGSGSDQPGVCPACGMDYVVNENHEGGDSDGDGHDHEGSDHEGHNH